MFAPPICRRRWRNTLFRSVSSDEDGGNPANIAASGASNRTQRDPQRAERAIQRRLRATSEHGSGVAHASPSLSTRNTAVIEVGKDGHVFLMRVTLPDRPGSLGSVATAMGSVGADINAVEIVEKKSDGSVVDDFIVDLPPNQLPESLVTACQNLTGVRVEWIARYPEGGGLQSDLEALERMTADPPHAAETLVSLCPVVFRSHWATLIEVTDGAPRPSFSTTLAPDLTPEIAARFTPFDTTHRTDLEADWSPGWGDTTAVVTPLTGDRVIVIGRLGGPAFLESEIARLHHLAALVK
jgi:hypothetical protein